MQTYEHPRYTKNKKIAASRTYQVSYRIGDSQGYRSPFQRIMANNQLPDKMFQPNVDPADILSRANIDDFEELNIHGGMLGATDLQDALGRLITTPLVRYQGYQGTGITTWDNDDSQPWYHYCYFPVERTTFDHSRRQTLKRGCFYVAMYSNFDPWGNTQNPASGHTLPLLPPQWTDFTTAKGASQDSELVKVDIQYLDKDGSADNFLSVASALNNCHPRNTQGQHTSYICFFPLVTPSEFNNAIVQYGVNMGNVNESGAWAIQGASFGLALMGAVLGMPSISYSSFIRFIAPKTLIDTANSTDYDPTNPVVQTPAQINFLESVDSLPLKMAAAASSETPLIIPAQDAFLRPLDKGHLSRVAVAMGSSVIPHVRTMASIIDGENFFTDDKGSVIGMAATLQDAITLASFYWLMLNGVPRILASLAQQSMPAIQGAVDQYHDNEAALKKQRLLENWREKEQWKMQFAKDPQAARAALVKQYTDNAQHIIDSYRARLRLQEQERIARLNEKGQLANLRGQKEALRYTRYFDPNAQSKQEQKVTGQDIAVINQAIRKMVPKHPSAREHGMEEILSQMTPRRLYFYKNSPIPMQRSRQQPAIISHGANMARLVNSRGGQANLDNEVINTLNQGNQRLFSEGITGPGITGPFASKQAGLSSTFNQNQQPQQNIQVPMQTMMPSFMQNNQNDDDDDGNTQQNPMNVVPDFDQDDDRTPAGGGYFNPGTSQLSRFVQARKDGMPSSVTAQDFAGLEMEYQNQLQQGSINPGMTIGQFYQYLQHINQPSQPAQSSSFPSKSSGSKKKSSSSASGKMKAKGKASGGYSKRSTAPKTKAKASGKMKAAKAPSTRARAKVKSFSNGSFDAAKKLLASKFFPALGK